MARQYPVVKLHVMTRVGSLSSLIYIISYELATYD